MGCDIHGPYIEQVHYYYTRDGGSCEPTEPGAIASWTDLAVMHFPRNYALFSLMADVRNGRDEDYIKPVAQPRGVPWGTTELTGLSDDCSWAYANHYGKGGEGCHSHSWMTVEDLIECQMRWMKLRDWNDPNPDATLGPNPSLAMAISLMTAATLTNPGYPVRALFCFDS